MPVNQNVNKAREQAGQAFGGAVEQARTPLLAVLGAGDLAAHAVVDTVNKVREQLNERAESARAGVNDLPNEFTELRSKLEPAELRKIADAYANSAMEFYGYLANRGEDTLGKFRSQPQVQRAEGRVEEAVGDARELADDVLGKVSRTTRSFGEKAAETTEQAADDVAETVKDTADTTAQAVKDTADATAQNVKENGSKAASNTRSTAQKTANKAAAAKSTTSTSTSSTSSTSASNKQPKSATRKTSTS